MTDLSAIEGDNNASSDIKACLIFVEKEGTRNRILANDQDLGSLGTCWLLINGLQLPELGLFFTIFSSLFFSYYIYPVVQYYLYKRIIRHADE